MRLSTTSTSRTTSSRTRFGIHREVCSVGASGAEEGGEVIANLYDRSPCDAAAILNRRLYLILGCFFLHAFAGPEWAAPLMVIWIILFIPVMFSLITFSCPNCGKSPAYRHIAGPIILFIPLLGYPNIWSEEKCSKCSEDLTKSFHDR